MSLRPGAAVIILYILLIFIKYKSVKEVYKALFLLTLFIGNNLRMGYFVKLGKNDISYFPALLMFVTIVGIVFMIEKNEYKIKTSFFKSIFALISVLIANYIAFYMMPYTKPILVANWDEYVYGRIITQSITKDSIETGYYVTLICFAVTIIISRTFFSNEDWIDILRKTIFCSKIIILLGYLEYIITNIFKTKVFTDVYIYLFGESGVQQNNLYLRGFLLPAQGMTKEAGMFVTSLFYIGIFFILGAKFSKSDKDHKRYLLWLVSTIVLIALNLTLAGVIYNILLIAIEYCFTISDRKMYRRVAIMIGTTICAIFILVLSLDSIESILVNMDNYLLHRIGLAIQQIRIIFGFETGNIVAGSESSRFAGINYNLGMMLKRPILGFGIGVLKCISGVSMMLSGIGILGFLTYVNFLIKVTCINKTRLGEIAFFMLAVIAPNLILNDFSIFLELELPVVCIIFSIYNSRNIQFYNKGEVLNVT